MDKPQGSLAGFPFSQRRIQDLLLKITRHNVYVETEENYGSGVRISPTEVLSVYHVAEEGSWIKVNGRSAEILHKDKQADLLLLSTPPCRTVGEIEIRPYPNVFDDVVSIGNLKRKRGLVDRGTVMGITATRIYMSNRIMDGFSGGGLYLLTGELVGLIQRVHGDIETGRIPVAVPGKVIQKFLSEARRSEARPQLSLDIG